MRWADEMSGGDVDLEELMSDKRDEVLGEGWEGMKGVEPEGGILRWVEEAIDQVRAFSFLLSTEEEKDYIDVGYIINGRFVQVQTAKEWNEAEIQRLYDLLEALWVRLNVSRVDIDEFIEENRGSSTRCLDGVRSVPASFPSLPVT